MTPRMLKARASSKNVFRSGRKPKNTGNQRALKPQIIGTMKPHVESIKYL